MRRGLDAEYLTVRGNIDLGQRLYRIDLCDTRSVSPDGISKRESECRVAGRIPSLVPIVSGGRVQGNVWKERSTANLGGEGISRGRAAPHLL